MAKSGKLARLIADFDGPELARLLGIAPSTIYRWQRALALPSDESVVDLALATGIAASALWEARGADRVARRRRK